MSRINTNVTSLVAQQRLGRNNEDLATSLARLSTGLRINSAKDDPAGLIASENLRRDITVVNRAITNSERASQLIATTEGALGQVSNLLNDIRGLVTEAANSGALSADQIDANQLQVDSSLEAIDRISQVTTFQGSRVLDGSLAFITTAGAGFSTITDLNIDQANLGAAGQKTVNVDITQAATIATITETGTPSANANATLRFGAGMLTSDGPGLENSSVLRVEANLLGFAAGSNIEFTAGGTAGAEVASYDAGNRVLQVSVQEDVTTLSQVVTAINNVATTGVQFTATIDSGGDTVVTTADTVLGETLGTINFDQIVVTADAAGPAFNNFAISIVDGGAAYGATTVAYDAVAKTIIATIDETGDDLSAVATALDGLVNFSAAVSGATTGDGYVTASADGADFNTIANTGTTGGAVLTADVTFRISGDAGSEVFSFASGATYSLIADAINSVTDATGVAAAVETNGDLTLTSSGYGTEAVVDVEVITEGVGGLFATGLDNTRVTGTDIQATINGVTASGKANTISLNTSALDLSFSVTAGSSTDLSFTITGGGAIFQLGGQVVTNQQARLGIDSIATARLGGATGRLFELARGNARDLSTDTTGAAAIVDEVIDKISSLRGRLGAFERTTLETNIRSLQDTVANLSEAESLIRDADFAKESAALTRAQILVQSGTSVLATQILVQSGTSVLAIANQNPQNVLALLG